MINVIITRGINPSSRAAFGTAVLLLNEAKDYTEYANLTAVAVDYANTTDAYKIAAAYFGQEQAPTKLAIAGAVYTEEVTVSDGSFTQDAGLVYDFPNDNVKVGSLTDLQDTDGPIPASEIDSIDYEAGKVTFNQAPNGATTGDFIYYADPAAVITVLNAAYLAGRDFYGIMIQSDNYRWAKAVNDWVIDKRVLPVFRTQTLPADYPVVLENSIQPYYHLQADEYLDAAVFGRCLPRDPGALTWNLQPLAGITANALETATESLLKSGRFNTATLRYGTVATKEGFYGTDLFIDQKRSQDFIEVTMANNIGALLIRSDKVPYDDRGIAMVVAEVEDTLNTAYTQGIIAAKGDGKTPDFVVNYQSRVEIVQDDPTAITERILRSVTFQYVEAGAIENATITGQVVLEL